MPYPTCHLAHVQGPARDGRLASTAVWICEYPYRTMRLEGPSADCAGCPVWQAMEQARMRTAREALTTPPYVVAEAEAAIH